MKKLVFKNLLFVHADEIYRAESVTIAPGSPGSFYKRNGDPGDPPEPHTLEEWQGVTRNGEPVPDDDVEEMEMSIIDAAFSLDE